jgi:hypothetical protein
LDILQLPIQGCQGPFPYFWESLWLLPGMLKDQEAADKESRLKKLKE